MNSTFKTCMCALALGLSGAAPPVRGFRHGSL